MMENVFETCHIFYFYCLHIIKYFIMKIKNCFHFGKNNIYIYIYIYIYIMNYVPKTSRIFYKNTTHNIHLMCGCILNIGVVEY